jgi:hypothetical protein
MQESFIETYGDSHLHSGFYPIAENEKEMHRCDEGMYNDDFPEDYRVGPVSQHEGPIILNNSSDPLVRYGRPEDEARNYEVGTGCMNLNCMAPNCHGQIRCPHCGNSKVGKEGFGIGCGCSVNNDTLFYLGVALALFVLWYFYLRKK